MINSAEHWNFDNSYIKLPSNFYEKQLPEKCANPKKIYFNSNLATQLGLDSLTDSEVLDYFSGNKIPNGSIPISQAYAGHQFGHFTMLGDGRAILLGEHINPENFKYDIQLKGSGVTPYSRKGDGKATLSSVLREYLISESMYSLGIPTTRSLAAIQTGEKIYRNQIEDGGILTRVSSSHIRFGTFEFIRNYCSKDDLNIFVQYVINRHYPQIEKSKNSAIELFDSVMNNQINLTVDWMRVGFIHGVMNTDNMSICGETIDFGPCAFMNTYNPDTVFSSIDRNGRYSFGNQPNIAHWNLAVFANTLIPIISNNENEAIERIKERLDKFSSLFYTKWYDMMFKKIGISAPVEKDKVLVDTLLELMTQYKADYTNTFAALTLNKSCEDKLFSSMKFKNWHKKWKERINFSDKNFKGKQLMKNQNPLVIPRNHLVESALQKSEVGDFDKLNEMLDLVSRPYELKSNFSFQNVPTGFDENYKTFCGT